MAADKSMHIRPARQGDRPAVRELMAGFDMVGDFTMENCRVAEVDGALAGFARVEYLEGNAYLRPIVVDRAYQGRGIGKALLMDILAQGEDLIVIARGSAAGFYSRLGFELTEWLDIPRSYRDECNACPDLEDCRPIPLAYSQENAKISPSRSELSCRSSHRRRAGRPVTVEK